MQNNKKIFTSIILIALVAIAGYFVLNKKASQPTQLNETWDVDVPVQDAHYKQIELSQVKDNASSFSTSNFVITSGIVVGITIYPQGGGASLVLSDLPGNYILATISHAGMSDFASFVPKLHIDDVVEVKGVADITEGIIVNSPDGKKIESIGVGLSKDSSFGLISLTGIKKVYTPDLQYKKEVLAQFQNLAFWSTEDKISDWRANTLDQTVFSKFPIGRVYRMTKSFNQDGFTGPNFEGYEKQSNQARADQKLLEDNVRKALVDNGWQLTVGPSEPGFYQDYLYMKNGHPLVLSTGERDAVIGMMYVSIQFQY